MAYSTAAQRLVERYRAANQANQDVFEAYLEREFLKLVTLEDVTDGGAAWMTRVMPQVMAQRRRSGSLARQYMAAIRKLEVPAEAPTFRIPALAELSDGAEEAARASLWIMGPYGLQQRLDKIMDPTEPNPDWVVLGDDDEISEASFEKARKLAATDAARAGSRHGLAGGRDVVKAVRDRDPVAVGWFRTAGANCCHFCGLLASRGAVYQEQSFRDSDPLFTGDGTAKVHDGCNCHMMPAWRREDFRNAKAREIDELYKSVEPKRGQSKLNAFRSAYDAKYRVA